MANRLQMLLEYFYNYRQFSCVWLATLVVVIFMVVVCHYIIQRDEIEVFSFSPSQGISGLTVGEL